MTGGVIEQLMPPKIYASRVSSVKQLAGRVEFASDLLKLCQSAISAFLRGELFRFDALVGENRCEVRAIGLLRLYSDSQFLQSLRELSRQLTQLQSQWSSLSRLSGSSMRSLPELLEGVEILSLTEPTHFLVLCYALCFTKYFEPPTLERSIPGRLVEVYPGIGATNSWRSVRYWQQCLARRSVELLTQMQAESSEFPKKLLEVAHDEIERLTAPGLLGAMLCCSELRKSEAEVVLVVNVLVRGEPLRSEFIRASSRPQWKLGEIDPEKGAFVVEGCMHLEEESHLEERIQTLRTHDFDTLFLANYSHKSDHPSGVNCSDGEWCRFLDSLRARYQSIEGCSLTDPSLFALVHVSTHLGEHLLDGTFRKGPRMLPQHLIDRELDR